MESEFGRRSVLMGGGAALAGTAAAVGASALGATPAGAEPIVPLYIPVGPIRVYDSRDTGDRIVRNEERNLFAGEIDPAILPALNFNVTITGTAGNFGFLSVFPGDEDWPGSSTLNWFAPSQTLANTAYTFTGASDGSINVRCGGNTGTSTHFILDVTAALEFFDLGVAVAGLRAASTSDYSGLDKLKHLQETLKG